MEMIRTRLALAAALALLPAGLAAQDTAAVHAVGDSVALKFVDADLRAVIQALSSYLPRPVLVTNVPATRVSLETPAPVARPTVAVLLKGLVESQNLEFSEDSVGFRIGPKSAAPPPPPPAPPPAQQPVQLFVIRLKHARAADVAATVNQLFGGGGEFSGRSGLATGTLSDELRRQNVPPEQAGAPAQMSASAVGVVPGAPRATLTGQVTLVPDQLSNSLLIRASAEDFAVIKEAVDQLDIRPLQVLIEVLVVEAQRDKNFSLGADLFLPPQGVDGGTIAGTLTGGGLGDLVIKLMGLTKAAIDATLRTAQSKGYVDIVSRPVLLASNNVEARILVGSQRPFVQVSRSLPTDVPSRDQVIQYRDVGTKLTVRPTINQDGYVSLVIQQEINAATGETQFDAPVISTREAATQVLVRDGQTIVLGGLRDVQRERSSSGVPVLSGIPFIGGVFGSTTRRTTTTELYLFLTPRIIRTDADADSLTAPRLPKELPR
ncbi:MAG TPA: secretin N-terminal domain-containing protein [Gemmatimonadales bacterium]|nr:secretin N-terminal domain-containing protein [Gemmatimonadales bacterium]